MNTISSVALAAALAATSCHAAAQVAAQVAAQAAAEPAQAMRWTRVADATVARQEIYPAVLDGRIVVAGGVLSQAPGFTDHVEAYDPKADRWTTLAPLPEGRHHIALAEAGGRI